MKTASGIPIHCAFDEVADVATLVPNPLNPNRHPASQIDLLARIIKEQGWRAPITVSTRSGMIVRGHARLEAALKAGWREVPIDRQDYESEAAEWADLIADNRLAELAECDSEALLAMLRSVESDGVLELTGYDPKSLAALVADVNASQPHVEDFDVDGAMRHADEAEPEAPCRVERGDIWLCGKHRVMCGDSTQSEDVAKLMAGERAVLFATDPPYLVDYDGTNHPHKWGAPDKNKDWSKTYRDWDDSAQGEPLYDGFIAAAVQEAIREDAAWYCWHASRNQAMLERVWTRHGAFVHQQIIWVKDRPILTRSWYMWQHEPCFFGWKKGHKPPRVADDYPPSIWTVPTIAPGTTTDHPTSKPVALFETPLLQHTVAGELCYDPFLGSGTALIAAERLVRICYGMEIEPRYVQVILTRWEAATGQEAILAERIKEKVTP